MYAQQLALIPSRHRYYSSLESAKDKSTGSFSRRRDGGRHRVQNFAPLHNIDDDEPSKFSLWFIAASASETTKFELMSEKHWEVFVT
jgi:hypothetical protein